MNDTFNELWESLQSTLTGSLPRLLGAIGILVGGWLIAVLLRAAVRRGLRMLKLNERVRGQAGGKLDLEGGVASGVFYLAILLTLIGFFNVLRLSLVSQPLQSLAEQVLDFVPNLVAAGVLILLAWLIATILRRIVNAALSATTLDEKLSAEAGMKPMSHNVGNVLYGVVLLLFLPAVLGTLQLDGLLQPIQNMIDEILSMVPNILAAVAIGVGGWLVARLLRNLTSSLLQAVGTDRLGERLGIGGSMTLSRFCGLLVHVFVFVPALIAALDALQLKTISSQASDVLGAFMAAIPNLFAAALILTVAFYVSRLIGSLVSSLLEGIGFDRLPAAIGLGRIFPETRPPSKFAGRVVVFFVMLFALVEAAEMLSFTVVSDAITMFIEFGGQMLLGIAIIGVGLWLSNLAHSAISRMQRPNASFMAGLARFAILGLVLAMGLRAMGIADDIVNLAFALTLGSIAVAVALSFGLGGREAAGRQMEHWLSRFRQ